MVDDQAQAVRAAASRPSSSDAAAGPPTGGSASGSGRGRATKRPVLVLGASGLLGRAVDTTLRQAGHQVIGTAHRRSSGPHHPCQVVDLIADATESDLPHVTSLLDRIQPSVIINCVAERRPDQVQSFPQAAELLNVGVPRAIARWCVNREVLHVHVSTDYVFDGTSPP